MALLSPFQKEKLEYFFNFFDSNGDKFIEFDDLDGFMKRIVDYTGWKTNSPAYHEIYGVHEAFFEILMEKTAHKKVTLDDWYKLWAKLIHGSMGMQNFPVWLRLLPRSLFRIKDRDQDGLIKEEDLTDFYSNFVQLEDAEANVVAKKAYELMTDFGRYPLNLASYEQIFANFLLGKTPHGPGRFIFGCFEHSTHRTKFQLIKAANDDEVEIPVEKINTRRGSTDIVRLRLKKV
ncbi:sarcoplasmic calcium-binding proteins I, III, and IV-like [Saccostrea echinata]|uniref:sarcoplasmic calcium-binding proteins I, III, and IV-like n=1 Tax=Saccostrea echinata TaxID=191078 RepID=UPI002A7F29C9|nr:sarcoplasmic calcium-binding proteins I, III, and IV-like [Saccostrea echinata]